MLEKKGMCIQCFEAITNPICDACHYKEIDAWLKDWGMRNFQRAAVLAAIKHTVDRDTIEPMRCVVCGKESLSTCSYCFFLNSVRELKRMNFSEEMIKDFLKVFNFRAGHSPYWI